IEKIWDEFIETELFLNLFKEKKTCESFQNNEQGSIEFTLGLFKKINAEYHVLSYEKNKNLLFDIVSPECTSTILLTIDQHNDNVLLRLDHRSFVGICKKQYHRSFNNRWKKIFNTLHKKEKQAV
ncbi:MAG: hypothetical protein ACRCV0_02490, partial [Brevinema sp.]